MQQTFEYHVLVNGFEIQKNKSGDAGRKTELRHYRYDSTVYNITCDGGAWVVKEGKEFRAAFPVGSTMILFEKQKNVEEEN